MAEKKYVDFKRFKRNVPWRVVLESLEIPTEPLTRRGQTLIGPCPFPHADDKLHDDDEVRFDRKDEEGHVYFCRVCEAQGDSVDFVKRVLQGSHGDVRRWILKTQGLDDWLSGAKANDETMIDRPRTSDDSDTPVTASELRQLREAITELKQVIAGLTDVLSSDQANQLQAIRKILRDQTSK